METVYQLLFLVTLYSKQLIYFANKLTGAPAIGEVNKNHGAMYKQTIYKQTIYKQAIYTSKQHTSKQYIQANNIQVIK